jgi:hypothetical protein
MMVNVRHESPSQTTEAPSTKPMASIEIMYG